MKLVSIFIAISLLLTFTTSGQKRIIIGKVITEDLNPLSEGTIRCSDTILLGKTDIEGKFKVEVPIEIKTLSFSGLGMERTIINLPDSCDYLEVILMYQVIYDYITANKADKLRLERFKKLPELHQLAYQKGIFLKTEYCFIQDFISIKRKLKVKH